jgi:hypothetical protein
MRQHGHVVAPLVAFHGSTSPTLPDTPPEEIEAARAEGRRVLHVHFVKPDPEIALTVTGALPGAEAKIAKVAESRY